jgi:hypothetical protein
MHPDPGAGAGHIVFRRWQALNDLRQVDFRKEIALLPWGLNGSAWGRFSDAYFYRLLPATRRIRIRRIRPLNTEL